MATGAVVLVELVLGFAVLALIIVGAAVGWERYRGGGARGRGPGVMGAQPTAEIFIDPETGRRMRVWFDPQTGRRDYRPE
ncbi:MAG: hypothetical protein ABSE52_01280 [Candidatus Dormibacteria bacterium]|jgi:hypothetical protein